MAEICDVVSLQSVLVLGAGEAATDVDVLHRLQIQGRPGNFREFAAKTSNHLVGADLAFFQRLELHEHSGGICAITTSGERRYSIDRRVRLDDLGESDHFRRDGGEGDVLVPLNEPVDAAGILLREKTHVRDLVEINVQTHGGEGDEKYEPLMAQNPPQAQIVAANQSVKG